jgi:sec-independent protein translocase protein TatC
MRRFLRRLARIITAPFRLLAWPFRALRRFINREPEDVPTADAFSRTLQDPSVLIEHIEALRKHLIRSLVALAIAVAFSFTFASSIVDFLAQPVGGIAELQAIEVTESVAAFMRVSMLSGFVMAFPYVFLEFFLFANPGLKRRERLIIMAAAPIATALFVGGMAFAYYLMFPTALPFLMNFMGITTVPRPANYIRFVTSVMFWIGITFQFPLIVYALSSIGLLSARTLAQGWRIAMVAIAVFAAAITPTVDPVNMGLVMAPMIMLYFVSIGLAAIATRSRARRAQAEEG